METISNNAKAILKLIQKTKPNLQERFYDIQKMDLSMLKMDSDDLIIGLERLIEIGALNQHGRSVFTISLTDKGKNYFQYSKDKMKDTLLQSVFMPSVVALITSIIANIFSFFLMR